MILVKYLEKKSGHYIIAKIKNYNLEKIQLKE